MERIESHKNAKIKSVKKLHTRKGREKLGSFFIEGAHLVEEALQHNVIINELFIEENYEIPKSWDVKDIPIYILPNKLMKEISETETPQGIAAVCELLSNKQLTIKSEGQYLLIDGIQDPGNLGTIIRTADSAGISAVILGNGTVDMYNSKVIRSTQGSLFHLPVVKGELIEVVTDLKKNRVPLFGTALDEKAKSYKEVSGQESFALIVGNEGSGLSNEMLGKTDENLYIPIFGKAESLNVAVATGILLYQLR